ncbi:MAG: RES family NAD+ phosphorylase [Gammaproteobacteria bacterium]
MRFYRIADARYAEDRGQGASLWGGRWNSPGRPVIYACETFSGAMLEKLVHTNGHVPANQVCVVFEAPDDLPTRAIAPGEVGGWDSADMIASRAIGDSWLDSRETAVLLVPSVVFGDERNVLVNPKHPHFERIRVLSVEPLHWDERLSAMRSI